jgi:hypothetical protein
VLVVENGDGVGPPSPPADVTAYETAVGAAIDARGGAIAALVIEREVDPPGLYAGTVDQYLAELTAGCEVAHQRGVACANAGLASTSLLLLLADYYQGLGSATESARILSAASDNPTVAEALNDALGGALPESAADVAKVLATNQAAIDKAKALVAGYAKAGVDYANFHWYERDEDTFYQAIAFMRAVTGCQAVITDELGQRAQSHADAFFKLSDAKALGLPIVVWFSHDTAGSASLVDGQGDLLPSGVALQELSTTATCGQD